MIAFLGYLVQVFLLIGIIIVLHSQRKHIGIIPLFFVVVTLAVLLNFSNFINIRIQLDAVRLGIAGHVIAPVILASLMLVYIMDGTQLARLELLGIVGVNVLTIIMLAFVVFNLNLHQDSIIPPNADASLIFNMTYLQRRFASLSGFVGAMITLAVVFQFLQNVTPRLPQAIIIILAFLAALMCDSILFFIISDIGLNRLLDNLQNDILGKMIASMSVGLPLSLYITLAMPPQGQSHDISKRPTLSILFGEQNSANALLKEMEAQLRGNRRIYEELTRHIEDVFWMSDVKMHEIIYISPAFERITGYQRGDFYRDFIGAVRIIHPDDRMKSKDMTVIMQRLIRQKEHEFRLIHADGSIRWMRNQTFSIKNDQGVVYRYAGIMEDITEKKLAAEQRFKLALADERVKVLHEFVRDASHDLKTLLGSMMLKLELLERYIDTPRRTDIIEELKGRTDHLAKLIDDLFILSRIEGQELVPVTEFNLVEFVTQLVHEYQPLAEAKGLKMQHIAAPENLRIQASPEQLQRVVGNLISNAIRYTDTGTITVTTAKQNGNIQLVVADTGIGIPPDELSRVFQRFHRSANAHDKSGTGLGLAIVKAIVEKYGGEITVTSQLNQGSTFMLELPRLVGHPSD